MVSCGNKLMYHLCMIEDSFNQHKLELFMKKLFFLTFALMIFDKSTAQGTLTVKHRKYAAEYLEKTKQDFFKSIENLSEAQLNFKSKTSKWSILECAEHIAISEEALFNVIKKQLILPADSVKSKSLKMTEKKIIGRLTFRFIKVKAPEQIRPTGRFNDISSVKVAFEKKRLENILYIQSTNDTLLHHYWKHPATGTIDLYQTIILMSAHCKRHTLQIEEVKSKTDFPK